MVRVIPQTGIEIDLNEYHRLRAFHGGGEFWHRDYQDLIRNLTGLQRFLPAVQEDKAGLRATFSQFVAGREVAGVSRGDDVRNIPQSEIVALVDALERLKRAANEPRADPNRRDIIQSFRLPNPNIHPEMYRVYGRPWNRKLLVLWGCERAANSSVALEDLAAHLRSRSDRLFWLRRLVLLLLLLALLALAAAAAWKALHHTATHPPRGDLTSRQAGVPVTDGTGQEQAASRPGLDGRPSPAKLDAPPAPAGVGAHPDQGPGQPNGPGRSGSPTLPQPGSASTPGGGPGTSPQTNGGPPDKTGSSGVGGTGGGGNGSGGGNRGGNGPGGGGPDHPANGRPQNDDGRGDGGAAGDPPDATRPPGRKLSIVHTPGTVDALSNGTPLVNLTVSASGDTPFAITQWQIDDRPPRRTSSRSITESVTVGDHRVRVWTNESPNRAAESIVHVGEPKGPDVTVTPNTAESPSK